LQLAAVSETALRQPSGLESVFLEHQRRVFRAAYRITGNAQDAEDVLQTVFLRLARQGDAVDVANPSSYLYRAAVNAALDLLRARPAHKRRAEETRARPPAGPRPVHEAASCALVARASRGCRPGRRGVRLHHLEGLDKEIARRWGLAGGGRRSPHRARYRLQQQFRDEERQAMN
jgi:RNA polymerase sigma-70 factor (ECF subfamily)